MKKLIKELKNRNWEFEVKCDNNGSVNELSMILGNEYKIVNNDNQAEELLKEIKEHW